MLSIHLTFSVSLHIDNILYRLLLAGEEKDEALRQAMATVCADETISHPYNWAAFFLTGDPAGKLK